MRLEQRHYWFWILILITAIMGCKNTPDTPVPDSEPFDRGEMLAGWVDHIIIPGYENFVTKALGLKNASKAFVDDPTDLTYESLVTVWENCYLSWQRVAMFDIGPAETLRLRDNINLYPTDVKQIEANANSDELNLELPSMNVTQGLPALDYLLFGINDGKALAYYQSDPSAASFKSYIYTLTTRIHHLATTVLSEWSGSYREEFIQLTGNNANGSVDRLVNDYIFYIEKVLRAGKFGIPAGVFSATPLADRVEAYYHRRLAKALSLTAIDAVQDFYNGRSRLDNSIIPSLIDYVEYTGALGDDLNTRINDQFDEARNLILKLSENYVQEIESDPASLLRVYDALQKNVVLLKIDLLQALNVQIDYVDADGD